MTRSWLLKKFKTRLLLRRVFINQTFPGEQWGRRVGLIDPIQLDVQYRSVELIFYSGTNLLFYPACEAHQNFLKEFHKRIEIG